MCDKPASDPDVVITWGDILDAERHGNVREISAGCSVWDRLHDFVGDVISQGLITYLEGGNKEGEEFGGEIYGLQILKRRLTPAEIQDMY